MKQFFLIFFVFGLTFITACNKDNQPNVIVNIQEEFSINLWEELGLNSRNFNLNLSTIKKNFKCQNYTIGFDQSYIDNKLVVRINDIIEPVICELGEGKALGVVDFNSLGNGFFTVKINLKNEITNEGLLEVNDTYYQLVLSSEDGISVAENRIYKVPNGLIWGVVQHVNEQISDDFLQDLQSLTEPTTLIDGNYGYFKFEKKTLTVNTEIPITKPTTFAFSLTGNSVELQKLIKKYKEENGDGLTLKVFTYRGEEF